jgi:AAA15 family ATPase/GTPase
MLNDLLISGFRALKQLEVEKLGRVNLITCKNERKPDLQTRPSALG